MESMNRACKYSPKEKKERMERYRSKRNLRNFNKKIEDIQEFGIGVIVMLIRCYILLWSNLSTSNKKFSVKQYERRKTLADSHPRIRGRFARNDETEKTPQQWDNVFVEEDDEGDDNWINVLDAFQQNLLP
ncbi:uncharacterized protein [Primulina huaijiensis]|uniref:uncharacterized protein n=1 Tax=Primulina huaijiensis TaxID=1492673 RepID=UPI003CC7637B